MKNLLLLFICLNLIGCNLPADSKGKQEFIINLEAFPYDTIRILKKDDEYAGSMDVELTPKDLWAVGYYYKTYGAEAVQEAIINWKNYPLKREQEGI